MKASELIKELRCEVKKIKEDAEESYRPGDDNNFLFGKVTACDEIIELLNYIEENEL